MNLRPLLAVTLSLLAAQAAPASAQSIGSSTAAIVYGADHRQDVYAHTCAPLRQLAVQSIAAMFYRTAIERDGAGWALVSGPDHGTSSNLCDGQRFADQPTNADCSMTLVTDDLVVTAGHCVPDQATCDAIAAVFDYHYESEGVLASIDADDVYNCAEVVISREDGMGDYALLRLDRPVVGRTPAPIRPDASYAVDDALTVIGFGAGLPSKIDSGGRITDLGDSTGFLATTDTFGGNSGSGVFDDQGQMIGILVAGGTDFTTSNGCTIVNAVGDDVGEEIITPLSTLRAEYCASANPAAELCSPMGASMQGSAACAPSQGTFDGVLPGGGGPGGDDGCSVGGHQGGGAGHAAFLLLALGTLALRRRR